MYPGIKGEALFFYNLSRQKDVGSNHQITFINQFKNLFVCLIKPGGDLKKFDIVPLGNFHGMIGNQS